MPAKRKYVKRRRRFRRRARMVARPSLNYHKYRLTGVIDLVTDSVAGNLGAVNYWIKNYNLNAAAVRVQGPTTVTGLSDVTSLSQLFDLYRVQYIKISYTPRFDKGAYTAEQGALNGMPAVYVSNDPDNENVDQAKTLLIQKQNTKRFDMSKPWTFSWKPRKLTNGGKSAIDAFQGGWLNLQGTFPDIGETQIKTDPWTAGATATLLNNEKIGELLLEYYVEFKHRR